MIFLNIWSLLTGFLLLVLAWRTYRFTSNLTLLKDLPHSEKDQWPKVSLVIPACNEASTIEPAMRSLLAIDYPNLEIILINDRSTDDTGAIIDQISLTDERIIPVHVTYLPEGWLGKVNALSRGIHMTSGELILVSDADVHFSKDSLKNAVDHMQNQNLGFLTVIPDVITKSKILHVVISQLFHQASLFFSPDKINDPDHHACYGQGAFMLLRKSVYAHSEQMQWLKMEVIDDTGLALMMRRAGAKMGAVSGKGQIKIEWYPSFFAFLKGIEKNGFAFFQYSLLMLFGFALTVWTFVLGVFLAPVLASNEALGVFNLVAMSIYMFTIYRQMSRILRIKAWAVLAFPLAFVALPIFFIRASLTTLRRKGVNWRGTFYPLKALKKNQRMKLANLVFAPQPYAQPEEEKVSQQV